MTLGTLLIQPQRFHRPKADPYLGLAQDVMRLSVMIAEDAGENGPFSQALVQVAEQLGERLREPMEPGLNQAIRRLRGRFNPVIRYFEDLGRDGDDSMTPERAISLMTDLLQMARQLLQSLSRDRIAQELTFLEQLISDDLGIDHRFVAEQVERVIDDIIQAWESLAPGRSDRLRRRQRIAVNAVRRVKTLLADDLILPPLDTSGLADELYQEIVDSGIHQVLEDAQCMIGKLEAMIEASRELGQALPLNLSGSTAGSQFSFDYAGDAYCWYASWLLAKEKLPLLSVGDIKRDWAFINRLKGLSHDNPHADAFYRHLYQALPEYVLEKLREHSFNDPHNVDKTMMLEVVAHLNRLMMTGPLHAQRSLNAPLVRLECQDALGTATQEHRIPIWEREFDLTSLQLNDFAHGPVRITAWVKDQGDNRIIRRFSRPLKTHGGTLRIKASGPDGILNLDLMTIQGGSSELAEGRRVSLVVTDDRGVRLPVMQHYLDEHGNIPQFSVDISPLAEGNITVSARIRDNNGEELLQQTQTHYQSKATELRIRLTLAADHRASVSGHSEAAAAGEEQNLSIVISDADGHEITLEEVPIDEDGNFSVEDIDLDDLTDGPIKALATTRAEVDEGGTDTVRTGADGANLHRNTASLEVSLEQRDSGSLGDISGTLSHSSPGRLVTLVVSGAEGNQLRPIEAITNDNGQFSFNGVDLRALPSGTMRVDAYALNNQGSLLTAEFTLEREAPEPPWEAMLSVDEETHQVSLTGTLPETLSVPQEPHQFTMLGDQPLELPLELEELRRDYRKGKLFLYNRRLLEHILGDDISHLCPDFWGMVGKTALKQLDWKKHSVKISADKRFVMCDKMPIHVVPPGEEAQWHEAPLFFEPESGRLPAAGSIHYTFALIPPLACEILTYSTHMISQLTGSVETLAGLQPGHEIGDASRSGLDLGHLVLKAFTLKPITGFSSLSWGAKWANSGVIGLPALATFAGSFQGFHTAATGGNQFWFWVTMILGDVVRPMGDKYKPAKYWSKMLDKIFICIPTLINSKQSSGEDPNGPSIKPANYLRTDGIEDAVGYLASYLLFKLYKPEDHSIEIWSASGIGEQRARAFLLWFIGAPIAGALSGLVTSSISMAFAWTYLDWKHLGKKTGITAGKFWLTFWFKEYGKMEGKTKDGKFSPPQLEDDFAGYPDQQTSPYWLPYTAGTNLYMGQGNNGLWSHNDITGGGGDWPDWGSAGSWEVYAYDFGHDHQENICAMRPGTVVGFRDSVEDNDESSGNYIVIRHDQDDPVPGHDDPFGTGTMLTFALYYHGAQGGVQDAFPGVANPVNRVVQRGDVIMLADDTGTSFHSHLHVLVFVCVNEDGEESVASTSTSNFQRGGVVSNTLDGDNDADFIWDIAGNDARRISIPLVFRDVKSKYKGVPKSLTWHHSYNDGEAGD